MSVFVLQMAIRQHNNLLVQLELGFLPSMLQRRNHSFIVQERPQVPCNDSGLFREWMKIITTSK